ncbi:MAG: alpha/beta hydrolase [Rhodospirillales bacterium]|nr:alpha/beta hydrolase [Rhodospirillales bacterium]
MAPRGQLALATVLLSFVLGACASPAIHPSGHESTMPSMNTDHFIAHDGINIPLRAWLPADQNPAAVMIAVHGFNDYSNFFTEPGTFLAERGLATYAYDQRGFGATPAAGIWPGVPTLIKDLVTVIDLVRDRHPDIPLFLFGESMGGAVVMVAIKEARKSGKSLAVDGVILSAPAVWGRETMPWYQTAALWFSAHTMPKAKLTGQGLKIMASDNIEMLRALGRDPLVIKKTRVDTVYGLTNLMDVALLAAREFDLPSLILYGEKDEIIPRKPIDLMLSRLPEAGKADRKVIFYANGYHMLTRDLQGQTVWRDIAGWIGSHPGIAAAR